MVSIRIKPTFYRRHVVLSRYTKFPKIEKYVNQGLLIKHRNDILVNMEYKRKTIPHHETIITEYNKRDYAKIIDRWNIYEDIPIENSSQLCYLMRRVVNSDPSRIEAVLDITNSEKKVIIFYNHNYELDILRNAGYLEGTKVAEWNGSRHDPIPKSDRWVYLVQYNAGAEGWNCIETNTMIFYSQNYSYRSMIQAAGRIDRLNTKFVDLYYYHLRSNAQIDILISKALKRNRTLMNLNYCRHSINKRHINPTQHNPHQKQRI